MATSKPEYVDVKDTSSGEEKYPTSDARDYGATDHGVGQSRFRKRVPKFSLEVRREESSFAKTKNASNADFDPIPPSKRTWKWHSYVAYWMADAWAVSNWEVASSIIAVGLDWKYAIGACVLGNFLMGLVITVNGRIGAIVSVTVELLKNPG
jgi:nucleobase:cation symporter-1, NCS1 family